jgi:GNAT superfamily N-acetyltransferase
MTATQNPAITISRLRPGDSATVQALFDRLGERSRRLRFGGVKPALTPRDLELLSRVDADRDALVAYAGGAPVGIAHLARDAGDPAWAEVGLAVADDHQGLGIGTALIRELAVDARTAGITHAHAWIDVENRGSRSLMRSATTVLRTGYDRGTLHVVGQLGGPHRGRR